VYDMPATDLPDLKSLGTVPVAVSDAKDSGTSTSRTDPILRRISLLYRVTYCSVDRAVSASQASYKLLCASAVSHLGVLIR
jgi:hypothetical protein